MSRAASSSVEMRQRGGAHRLDRASEAGLDAFREALDPASGPADDHSLDRRRAVLGAVVVQRDANLVDQLRGALLERLAGVGRGTLVGVERVERSPPGRPRAANRRAVFDRDLLALGEALGDRARSRTARRGRTGRSAFAGDREVGDVAEVAVEGASGRESTPPSASATRAAGRGSSRRRRGRCRPGCRPAWRSAPISESDHVAARGDGDDVHAPSPSRRSTARRPGGRAPPGRAASGSGPGPGSEPRSSSSSGSSISGSRRVRTTTRWLATPRRTVLRELVLREEAT